MAAAIKYTDKQLNYFRVCYITTAIIPDVLRDVFKQEWDTHFQSSLGQWQDTTKNANDFKHQESARNQKRNARLLNIMQNGNTREWNCTCLFYAILYSDSVGPRLNPTVRKSVDDLREFRNKVSHVNDGTFTDVAFRISVQKVIDAFTALNADTVGVQEVKKQKCFPTEGLRDIQQQLEEEKKRNEEPSPFCALPLKPSHDTTDRSGEVESICNTMQHLKETKPGEISVMYLSGNPGCGKSEMARQIGSKFFDELFDHSLEVSFVFTLDASTIDTLLQSYIKFANALRCNEQSITNIGTSKDLCQEEKLAQLNALVTPRVLKYPSWLLIVDNVTDLKSVCKYWPSAGEKSSKNGQVLVTTQDCQSIAPDSRTRHVSLSEGMTIEDAVTVLYSISGVQSGKEITVKVAKALDLQPLALACAATYMQRVSRTEPAITWERYLDKLSQGKRAATEKAYQKTSLTYGKTMTSAVKIAIDRLISEDEDVLKHAMRFLSFVAPEPISLEYVVQYVSQCMPDDDQELLADHITSCSLILTGSREETRPQIRVHQVVHSCLQIYNERIEKQVEIDLLSNVMKAISILHSYDENSMDDITETRPLVAHFVTLTKRLEYYIEHIQSIKQKYQLEKSLKGMGNICNNQGKYEASMICYQICLVITENEFGENHPNMAAALSNLAIVFSNLGYFKDAECYFKRALDIQTKTLHENHPSLATTLNNLGNVLSDLVKYKDAECYLKRALDIQTKTLDENHPLLAATLNNLGNVLSDLGKYKDAECYLKRALDIRTKTLDENHPLLAATLNNLGNVLIKLCQFKDAECYLKRALDIQTKTLDENHPSLAITLNNLGTVLSELGKCNDPFKIDKNTNSFSTFCFFD